MTHNLSQEIIGKRLAALRKHKDFSQEELAKAIPISRPSLAQIELGKRSLSALELKRIAMLLEFSIDQFLSENFTIETALDLPTEEKKQQDSIRISIPELKVNKFKNVLLYLLGKCAGKPNIGETALYKLLYFSDFNYYELFEEHLTGASYRKLPYGPVPHKLDAVIHQMIEQGSLQKVKANYHGYKQTRYLPLIKADLTQLKASETEVIDKVIDQYGDWSAAALSDYSHKDIPWLVSKEGTTIDYELAFYREAPYSVRTYEEDEME